LNQPLEEDHIDHHPKFDELPEVQNILSQILSIVSNIRAGCAYLSTSSHKSLHNIVKRNIESTVTMIPITAYLIVLIAGLIFSSFPPESIKSNPHHKIKTMDKTPAANTKIDISKRKKSQNVRFSEKIPQNLDTSLSKAFPRLHQKFQLLPVVVLVPKFVIVLPFGLNSPGDIELL